MGPDQRLWALGYSCLQHFAKLWPYIDRSDVKKLNGSNYRDWKFAMCVTLKWHGLWKYINGTSIYPVDEAVNICELHDKESDLAHSKIVQSIDKRRIHPCSTLESAKDAWDALTQQYNKVSFSSRHFSIEVS